MTGAPLVWQGQQGAAGQIAARELRAIMSTQNTLGELVRGQVRGWQIQGAHTGLQDVVKAMAAGA